MLFIDVVINYFLGAVARGDTDQQKHCESEMSRVDITVSIFPNESFVLIGPCCLDLYTILSFT